MMCTCSRQRSLSMKYFNKKHTIPKTKKIAAASPYFIRDEACISWLPHPSRFRIFVTVNTYIQIRIWNLKTRRQCRLNTVLYTHLDGQAFYLQVFFSTSLNAASIASDNMGHFLGISFVIRKVLRHFYWKIPNFQKII